MMLKKINPLQSAFDPHTLKEFDSHEMVVMLNDKSSGLSGIISLHSTSLGPALGGTRMISYPSNKAALKDVLNLSKAMSFKCAMAGLPFGGGKAVIIDNGLKIDRDQKMAAYAAMVEKLGGIFKTGTDVGVTDEDVLKMSKHTKHMLGVSEADRGGLTTSSVAALGVYYAIQASLREVFGSEIVKGRSVAVKGVGKLGGELVRILSKNGAKVYISDIDLAKARKLKRNLPNTQVVDNNSIHSLRVDVYSPCALGGELNATTIKQIQAKIIAGGANNQLANESIGQKLLEKGILYAPDYIANAGGLIYVADELEPDGFRKDRVLDRTCNIKHTLREVFSKSRKLVVATNVIANKIALERMDALRSDVNVS